jgi:high affinity sulfate transporter 1
VAALALPSGMAYAEVAGLSPVVGLYALLLPLVAYALFGSSRQLMVGPEAALALLTGAAVAPLADGDPTRYASLAALLALLAGCVYLLAWVIRLGWITDYFSRPVLVGYLHGVVVVLIVGQLGKMFGLSIDADEPIPQLVEFLSELDDISWTTLAVSVVSIVTILVLRQFLPGVPAPLVVVVAGIIASYALSLDARGVQTVGDIPAGLPSLGLPNASVDDVIALLPSALGIFAVGYADGVLTARSFAGRHGQHIRANQELLAFGAASVAAGGSQAFPVGASGSRTAVNDQAGGKTQLVGVMAAIAVALVLLFLTEPVALLPNACLGAVILVAALGLVSPSDWRALRSSGAGEVTIAVVAMVGVVTIGVLWALLLAVALSIIDVVRRSAKPHDAVLGWVERLGRYADMSVHPSARVTPGVVVYRLDDRLFYANARYFHARVLEAVAGAKATPHWLVLDAESIPLIDATGVETLERLLDDLGRTDVKLVVARIKQPLRDQFDETGLTGRIGRANFAANVEGAVRLCTDRTVDGGGEGQEHSGER